LGIKEKDGNTKALELKKKSMFEEANEVFEVDIK
jgi:hypothetical protein